MPNKRQREFKRASENRLQAISKTPKEHAERVPLFEFDGHYEITRDGDVYSIKLGRYIKHSYNTNTGTTYIGFTLNKTRHIMSIGDAIAYSYLSQLERESIQKKRPSTLGNVKELWKDHLDLLTKLAETYNVNKGAIYSVFKEMVTER